MTKTEKDGPAIEGAERVADTLIRAARDAGATPADPFFVSTARETLSLLLLAAAASRRSVADVRAWSEDPGNEITVDPATILAARGHDQAGKALTAIQSLPLRTRSSIYGTVAFWFRALRDERATS